MDLGGGTADIACHEVVGELEVEEIAPPSGGAWGGIYIDEAFESLMSKIFPSKWIDGFRKKNSDFWTVFLNNFQSSKGSFHGNLRKEAKKRAKKKYDANKEYYNVVLPFELLEYLEHRLETENSLGLDYGDLI